MKAYRVRKSEVVQTIININPLEVIEVFVCEEQSYCDRTGEVPRFTDKAAVYATQAEAHEFAKSLLSEEIEKVQKHLEKLLDRQKYFDLIFNSVKLNK